MEKLILSEDEISRICGRLASEIEPKLKEDDKDERQRSITDKTKMKI